MIIEPIEFKGKIYMCPCMDGQETAEYEREKKQKEFEEYESNDMEEEYPIRIPSL